MPLLKQPWRWAIVVGVFGIALSCYFALSSNEYRMAKHFMLSDPRLNNEFGEINWALLYGFRISDTSAAKSHNKISHFNFYVIAERKNAAITVTIQERDSARIIYFE